MNKKNESIFHIFIFLYICVELELMRASCRYVLSTLTNSYQIANESFFFISYFVYPKQYTLGFGQTIGNLIEEKNREIKKLK